MKSEEFTEYQLLQDADILFATVAVGCPVALFVTFTSC